MSEEDPSLEKVWKRLPIYDFYFRILELRKRYSKNKSLEQEPFGNQ